jgi:hypothetical protein
MLKPLLGDRKWLDLYSSGELVVSGSHVLAGLELGGRRGWPEGTGRLA